jgi:hypothetical protein
VRVLRWRKKDVTAVPSPATVSEANAEDWLQEGTAIVHATFGTGRVVRVGPYKGARAAWVDFDRGYRKTLDPEYASPHVRLRSPADADSALDPAIKCDACGDRPVVVTIAGAGGTQQFCEAHTTRYRP